MPPSYGFWFEPMTGHSFAVTRHQDWILQHAKAWGLQDAVKGLDPDRDEDEIRILGCQAGLVRVRDYGSRMSAQFWASEAKQAAVVLKSLAEFMSQIGVGPLKWVWVHNLSNNRHATMTAESFVMEAERGGPTLNG